VRFSVVFISAIFLFLNSSFANSNLGKKDDRSGCLDCFNFVAPSILGAENVTPAEIGLIVYDSYFNKFRGYTSSGAWSKLSAESVVRVTSATGSVFVTDDVVIANAASAAITLTLPSAATIPGKQYVFKKSDSSSNQVTIVGAGSETIDGGANRKLNIRYESVRLVSDGANWLDVSQKSNRTPTQSIVSPTSHSGGFPANGSGTYTTPAGVTYIKVRMIGGGSGGSGSGTAQNAGTAGGNTTFGSSLLVANGGGAGGASGGAGGSASCGSIATCTSIVGGSGGGGGLTLTTGATAVSGGMGGASAFGGNGGSGYAGSAGYNAAANSGSGGGGAGTDASASYNLRGGGGGGAGGFVDAVIAGPSATYSYAVGSGGGGGAAGTAGYVGGAGGAGYIEVTEYYQ